MPQIDPTKLSKEVSEKYQIADNTFSFNPKDKKSGFQKGHKLLNGGHSGYKHSEETKKHWSQIRKGIPPWNKGKVGMKYPNRKSSPHTEEHNRHISEGNKGKKKPVGIYKGKIFTEETRRKLSKANKGDNGSNWKGGITPINKIARMSIEFRLWREAVFARDNWTCQKTKIKGGYLHPHHIQNFSQFPELRFAIDNGITLSEKAHREFHKIYGMQNNTREQLNEFLCLK